jgi:hypothetical protein
MGLWRDSFEAQTDRMSATDAQGVLLDMVRAAREKLSPGVTSLAPAWIGAPEGETLRPSDDPLADVSVLLAEIEELLKPGKRGFWKLQLGQRQRGKRIVPSAIANDIFRAYGGELNLEENPRPKKVIIGDIAKEYGLTDETVRQIIRRMEQQYSGKKK